MLEPVASESKPELVYEPEVGAWPQGRETSLEVETYEHEEREAIREAVRFGVGNAMAFPPGLAPDGTRGRLDVTIRDKETKRIAKRAVSQGFIVSGTQSGHIKFTAPNGEVAFFSGSTSDHRAYQNLITKLRKLGFKK